VALCGAAPWESGSAVGSFRSRLVGVVQQGHVPCVTAARDPLPTPVTMHHFPIDLLTGWMFVGGLSLARSGPGSWALGQRLSAPDRRLLLHLRQQTVQAGKARLSLWLRSVRRFRPHA